LPYSTPAISLTEMLRRRKYCPIHQISTILHDWALETVVPEKRKVTALQMPQRGNCAALARDSFAPKRTELQVKQRFASWLYKAYTREDNH
jgi:hypothetical protein